MSVTNRFLFFFPRYVCVGVRYWETANKKYKFVFPPPYPLLCVSVCVVCVCSRMFRLGVHTAGWRQAAICEFRPSPRPQILSLPLGFFFFWGGGGVGGGGGGSGRRSVVLPSPLHLSFLPFLPPRPLSVPPPSLSRTHAHRHGAHRTHTQMKQIRSKSDSMNTRDREEPSDRSAA